MDTTRYSVGSIYEHIQSGYRDEDAKAMRFLDLSVGNSLETWKFEPRNLVVVACPRLRHTSYHACSGVNLTAHRAA